MKLFRLIAALILIQAGAYAQETQDAANFFSKNKSETAIVKGKIIATKKEGKVKIYKHVVDEDKGITMFSILASNDKEWRVASKSDVAKNISAKSEVVVVGVPKDTMIYAYHIIPMPSTIGNADGLRASGKIYIVVGVLGIILIGILIYMFMATRSIRKLEQD